MVQTVQAKYENGVLKPAKKLDLDEGDVVVVTISGSFASLRMTLK